MRKLFILLPVILFVIASFWTSCKKDNLQTLQGGSCDTCQAVCDTTFDISYANDIVPILTADCYSCHNHISAPALAKGNVLDDYNSLLVYAQDGRLVGAITHTPGFAAMPDGKPKISDCKIARIDRWVQNGAPNN